MKKYLLLFFVLGVAFFGGKFLVPNYCLPKQKLAGEAAIVFTGGTGRIDAGLDLLQKNIVPKLLISGVAKKTKLENITNTSLNCCIELDYKSTNTRENVQNSNQWLEGKNLNSIILITSDYHMPRSLAEFAFVNSALDIRPYCVASIDNMRWREYAKYLVTMARIFFAVAIS